MILKKPAFLKNFFFSYFLLLGLPILPFITSPKVIWSVYVLLLVTLIIEGRTIKFTKYPFLILLVLFPTIWSFFYSINADYYVIIQSLFYMLTPYLMLVLGIQLGGILKKSEDLYRYIVYSGTIGSALYLGLGTLEAGQAIFSDFSKFRSLFLWASITNVMAIIILLFSERYGSILFKKKSTRNLFLVINIVALLLTASRTYYLLLIVFLLLVLYDFKKTTFIFFVLLFLAILLFILSLDTDILFLVKIQNSISEISNTKTFAGYDEVNAYYRAYETQQAMNTYKSGTETELLIGHGLQQKVDLNIYVRLGGTYRRYIPVLHNGYAYLILRAGIFGCIFYGLFFLVAIFKKNTNKKSDKFLQLLFLGAVLSLLISNYVIASFFSSEMIFAWVVIGAYLYIISQKKII